jgi:uncharacterized secreted protein with C-terminal beta-propeller domain
MSAFKGEPMFESIERRILMAVDVYRGDTWEVYGTRRDDRIVITQDPRHPGYMVARNGDTILSRAVASTLRRIRVYGGEGNDQIFVTADAVPGPAGTADDITLNWRSLGISVDAGGGDDLVTARALRLWAAGGSGNDSLYGTHSDDVLIGGDGNDLLYGNSGRDRLEGNDGVDTLIGGGDRDSLIGGMGNDRLEGGEERDWIDGSAGRDSLYGGQERDTLIGGKHGDLLEQDHHRDTIASTPQDHVFVTRLNENWRTNPEAYARSAYENSGGMIYGNRFTYLDSFRSSLLYTTSGAAAYAARSDTNVQVSGVDEADLLETDGRYIYSIVGSELVITDIADPEALRVVSRTTLQGNIHGIYLDADRLTVVWQKHETATDPVQGMARVMPLWGWPLTRAETTITTFDLGDRTAPTIAKETTIEGGYTTSRYVNGRVYLVSSHYDVAPSLQGTSVEGFWLPEDPAAFTQRVLDDAGALGPTYEVIVGGVTTAGDLSAVSQTIDNNSTDTGSGTYITLIDTVDPSTAPIDAVELSGAWFNALYITASSIYLASDLGTTTSITKIGVSGNELLAEGTGLVEGRVNGQFAFDETPAGLLRVTSQVGWGQNASTTFTILRDAGETLTTTARLSGIAPGEDLYATRYIGDRAYFITYGPDWSIVPRFIDPLFVVDTSNASDPKLLGELKIPGYSQYLHPAGENHLIGLGQRDDDADGQADGLQLSLFDVSNPARPKRVDTYDFGQLPEGDATWSDAQFQHLAFTYVPETGMLAVPFNSLKRGSGLDVVKVDLATGFKNVLRVADPSDNWLGLRGVFVGNAVFAVGNQTITSKLLTDPTAGDSVQVGT